MPSPRHPGTWLAAFALLLAATLIGGPYPEEQALQQFGTTGGVALFVLAWRRWGSSRTALALFLLFLALHVVGARWVYSFVPYDEWSEALAGVRPSELFGWRRNHYDRFVHLAYGVLATPLFAEVLRKTLAPARGAALAFAATAIVATSALYEIGEWIVAFVAAPERADRYLGQQGDPWDAQWDMALAALGACATAAVLAARGRDVPAEPAREQGARRRRP